MDPFFQTLLEQFRELHKEVHGVLEGLPPAALDWEPGKEMNSISILVVHLAGSERYWAGDVVMGETSNRDRDSEFVVRGLTVEQLRARLDAADQYLAGAFARLTLADLNTPRVSPRNNKTFTVAWSLLHAYEHTALHLGHLQLIRQLWLQKQAG